jgi:hypothetical protein
VILMDCTQGRPESLAAFLARIRPGDACACCGAVLQPLHRGPRLGHLVSGQTTTRPVVDVVCPECGCEISEETGDADGNLGELSPAA